MNRLEKVVLITNYLSKQRSTQSNIKFNIDRIMTNTHNFNKYETEKYLQLLIENQNALNPYYRANKMMKQFYDYPANMNE